MIEYIVTVESGASVATYNVKAVDRFQAECEAITLFHVEHPHKEAQHVSAEVAKNAAIMHPSAFPGKSEKITFSQVVEKPLKHHKLGLTYTATGYGKKLPTLYMVKFNGRLHRVYSACFSNTSSEYIVSGCEKYGVILD